MTITIPPSSGNISDDFSGNSLNSALWKTEGPSSLPTVANGYARMQIGQGTLVSAATWSKFQSLDGPTNPQYGYGTYTMTWRFSRRPQESGQEIWAGWALYQDTGGSYVNEINFGIDSACTDRCGDTTLLFESYKNDHNHEETVNAGVNLFDGSFHTGEVDYSASSIILKIDGIQKSIITESAAIPVVKMQIIPGARTASGSLGSSFYMDIDKMTYDDGSSASTPTLIPIPTSTPTPIPIPTSTSTPTSTDILSPIIPPGQSSFTWDGILWDVRDGDTGNPGGNPWTNDNVWVDAQNRLHLKITHVGSSWYTSEIDSHNPVGYGTYTFDVASNPSDYAINTVAGMFYALDDFHEIDFMEYSKWNNAGTIFNSQSTVHHPSGDDSDAGYMTTAGESIITGIWGASSVEVKRNGTQTWYYNGQMVGTGGTLDINLWLYESFTLSDSTEQELIINSISSPYYIPTLTPTLTPTLPLTPTLTPTPSSPTDLFDILNETYITNISELPYSPGTPTVNWQQNGSVRGWIDIVGFRNLSRVGDNYYILGDPANLAIVTADAIGQPPGILDSLDKSISFSQSGNNLTASLNVVMKYHTIYCDDNGCFVNGRFTKTAVFQDIEALPTILSNQTPEIQVLFREMNFSLFNTTDLRININNSIYDRYILTTKNGSYEKINRLWRVDQTAKGIYYANESIVDIFHSDNISHAQDVISVKDLNFTVAARGLYFSTDKMNVTVQKETHDPIPQFLDGTLIGFLLPLGFFYLYIKRAIS